MPLYLPLWHNLFRQSYFSPIYPLLVISDLTAICLTDITFFHLNLPLVCLSSALSTFYRLHFSQRKYLPTSKQVSTDPPCLSHPGPTLTVLSVSSCLPPVLVLCPSYVPSSDFSAKKYLPTVQVSTDPPCLWPDTLFYPFHHAFRLLRLFLSASFAMSFACSSSCHTFQCQPAVLLI